MAEATQKVSPELDAEGHQVIVQCPACQTKFLVGAAALHGVDFPRFHCSRCDHLFSVDSTALGMQPAPSPRASLEPTQSDLFTPHSAVEEPDEGEDESPDLLAEDGPLPPVAATPTPTPTIDDFAPIPGSAIDSLAIDEAHGSATRYKGAVSGRGLDIPKRLDVGAKAIPPIPGGLVDEQQIAFDFIASSVPEDRVFDESEEPRTVSHARLAERVGPGFTMPWRTSGWRGVWAVSLPILGCLTVLGLAALSLGSDRSFDRRVAASLFPNAAAVAPADIRVVDTAFAPIALSNGETVHLITGTVINDSGADVSNVILEGLTFDAAGRILSSAKVTSGATLAHSRLQSLTPEIIVRLQSGENSKPLRLRAGESEKVSLALTDHSVREARFFAARVYSAKQVD